MIKLKQPLPIAILILQLIVSTASSQVIAIHGTFDSKTDGSLKLKHSDSLHLKPFNPDSFDKTFTYQSKQAVDFEYIHSSQLKQLFRKSEFTWVFIQSSWCGGCASSLVRYTRLSDSTGRIRIVVINQDMRIRSLQHKIHYERYRYQSYVLNPSEYGTFEPDKQSAFVSELVGTLPEGYNPGAVPQNLIFNRKGELVYYGPNAIDRTILVEKVFSRSAD